MGCCSCKSETQVRPFKQKDAEDWGEASDIYGPLNNRKCRDVIFFILFLGFICGLGAVTYLAVNQGNPYRLVYGVDSWGNVCNQENNKIPNVNLSGQDLRGLSKVFFLDTSYFHSFIPKTIPTPTIAKVSTAIICVKECPSQNKTVEEYLDDDNVNLCRYDTPKWDDDLNKCPMNDMVPHISWFNRCIPKALYDELKKSAIGFVSSFANIGLGGDITEKIVSDLKNTWKEIGYLAGIAVGVALIVVAMMKFLAAIIVWTLVILVIFMCLGATAYSW